MRCGAAIPGSSGAPATIGCGICSARPASARSTSSRSCRRTRRSATAGPARPTAWPTAVVRTGGSTSAWSTSRASRRPTAPNPDRWGLWLDRRRAGCAPDPFENAAKYPGVAVGSRGETLNGKPFETGSYYGYATGHRRLPAVPQPRLRRARRRPLGSRALLHRSVVLQRQGRWSVRIASACRAACATSARIRSARRPIPNNPEWANLSSNVGAQYFWTDRIFYEAADLLELRVPVVPLVAARIARHFVRLDRQHQQPADDERGLRAAAAAAERPALGPGDAGRRRPRQQAVQRLREGGAARRALHRPRTRC